MSAQFGLLGKTLTHSFSPAYFTAKFRALNLPHQYSAFERPQLEGLRDWGGSLPNLCGLNVTIPYKEAILPYLDWLSPEAQALGAVNTIAIHKQQWKGYNTDIIGFEKPLKQALTAHIYPVTQALILGTGGAAKAVAYVLKNLNIAYRFVSRNPNAQQLHYSQINHSILQTHLLLINTTPCGMYPNIDTKPDIPYTSLGKKHILYDLVYNPKETCFLELGKQQGARIQGGLEMLHGQAEAAWEIWQPISLQH